MLQLQYMYLWGNALTGSLPEAWGGLTQVRLQMITCLVVDSTNITVLPLLCLKMSGCNELLHGSRLHASRLPDSAQCNMQRTTQPQYVHRRETLVLAYAEFGPGCMAAIARTNSFCLLQLRELHAINNMITGTLPNSWGSLTQASTFTDVLYL